MVRLNKNELKLQMLRKGMTQGDLEREVGITQQSISHYMRGLNIPRAKTLMKICEVLGVIPDQILIISTEE